MKKKEKCTRLFLLLRTFRKICEDGRKQLSVRLKVSEVPSDLISLIVKCLV